MVGNSDSNTLQTQRGEFVDDDDNESQQQESRPPPLMRNNTNTDEKNNKETMTKNSAISVHTKHSNVKKAAIKRWIVPQSSRAAGDKC
jgi:hypothetical protein